MYGANNLVWQGVQNATIGTIYTTEYGFSTAAISAAYAGGVLGTIIGWVFFAIFREVTWQGRLHPRSFSPLAPPRNRLAANRFAIAIHPWLQLTPDSSTSGLYVGKVSKILTLRLARRNNGISEPEHTLYVFIASIFLVPFAMILYGLGVTYHLHWFALVALNGTISVSAALTYAISSYPELSGQMVTTCVLIRNTLSFAINFGITPWLASSSYLTVYCILAGIGFLWNVSLFVMTRYGRRIREMTAARYWRDVEKARAQGLGHWAMI
jgi:hypothetical protein